MTIAFPKAPPDVEAALSALARGDADGGLQRKAFVWIVSSLATLGESPMVPDNARQTDFNLGRQWVGLALLQGAGVSLVALPHLKLREDADG